MFKKSLVRSTALSAALVSSVALLAPTAQAIPLDASKQLAALTSGLIADGIYTKEELTALIEPVELDKGVLKTMDKQAEGLPWHKYKNIFLKQKRINEGVIFLNKNKALLARAHQEYGVPPALLTALIGVETFYGTRMGNRKVFRSLLTLSAAYPRRADFFSKELDTFLRLMKQENLVVMDVKGSYAGAIGIPQFMPTSYKAYAVDFNGNGKRDLVYELEDAVGSVANYLAVHGYQRDAPLRTWLGKDVPASTQKLVTKRAKPKLLAANLSADAPKVEVGSQSKLSVGKLDELDGDHYFYGYANFYAVTRYNPSNKYAMAIVELADAIAKKAGSD